MTYLHFSLDHSCMPSIDCLHFQAIVSAAQAARRFNYQRMVHVLLPAGHHQQAANGLHLVPASEYGSEMHQNPSDWDLAPFVFVSFRLLP